MYFSCTTSCKFLSSGSRLIIPNVFSSVHTMQRQPSPAGSTLVLGGWSNRTHKLAQGRNPSPFFRIGIGSSYCAGGRDTVFGSGGVSTTAVLEDAACPPVQGTPVSVDCPAFPAFFCSNSVIRCKMESDSVPSTGVVSLIKAISPESRFCDVSCSWKVRENTDVTHQRFRINACRLFAKTARFSSDIEHIARFVGLSQQSGDFAYTRRNR